MCEIEILMLFSELPLIKTIGAPFLSFIIEISLKYYHGEPVIKEIVRISKPGLRVYSSVKGMPVYRNNMGISIISTSKGVMTNFKAKEINIGGEVIWRIY